MHTALCSSPHHLPCLPRPALPGPPWQARGAYEQAVKLEPNDTQLQVALQKAAAKESKQVGQPAGVGQPPQGYEKLHHRGAQLGAGRIALRRPRRLPACTDCAAFKPTADACCLASARRR